MKNAPALVVMAAGMGSRYGGLKQIDPLGPNGQIILDYSIYDAYKAGFSKVIFIIKPELEDAFENAIGKKARKYMQVEYSFQTLENLPNGLKAPDERVKPLGTGHAVYCAGNMLDVPFAVINADDFYGADAFKCMYEFLSTAYDDDKYRYCMVSYKVENTLTENGTVSRGVCTKDKNGFLSSIIERTAIKRDSDGIIRFSQDNESGIIQDGTPVSMNMWGFTPSFAKELERMLFDFFKNTLPKNPEKAEFYLPYAVDTLIHEGKATAKLLTTDAKWFGVTYREDKPSVIKALSDMTKAGLYPENL